MQNFDETFKKKNELYIYSFKNKNVFFFFFLKTLLVLHLKQNVDKHSDCFWDYCSLCHTHTYTYTYTCPAGDTMFLFSLQVQLERIRQADSLVRIRAILNDTNFTDISQLPET